MSIKLSKSQISDLARLSRLRLSDEEIELYQKELSSILGYVEQLAEVDVSGLEPTSQVTGLTNSVRKDAVKDNHVEPKDLMAIVPNSEKNYIKVKRMI